MFLCYWKIGESDVDVFPLISGTTRNDGEFPHLFPHSWPSLDGGSGEGGPRGLWVWNYTSQILSRWLSHVLLLKLLRRSPSLSSLISIRNSSEHSQAMFSNSQHWSHLLPQRLCPDLGFVMSSIYGTLSCGIISNFYNRHFSVFILTDLFAASTPSILADYPLSLWNILLPWFSW